MSIAGTDLFASELLRVRHVACNPSHPGVGAIEHASRDGIVFPVRGVFSKHLSAGTQLLAEPTQALFFAAGRPYRVSHPAGAGDDCLVLHFAPEAQREALAELAAVEEIDHPRLAAGATIPPAAIGVRALLWTRLARGVADRLEVEETGLRLLSAAVRAARRDGTPNRIRSATKARRQEQALAVRELLHAAPTERWSLRELARRVHTTPFHLTRLFRKEVGLPVHQYLLRVRLARAVAALLESEASVTAIALDLGFATPSHFTTAFRAMVGPTPSCFRRAARAADAATVRAKLIQGATGVGSESRRAAFSPSIPRSRSP